MAIAVRGTDTADSGTGNSSSYVLSLADASAQAGDVALVVAEFSSSGATATIAESGWTAGTNVNISTTFTGRSWAKVLDSTDIANDTVTVNSTGSGRSAAGMLVLSGSGGLDSVTQPAETSESTNDTSNPFAGIDPVGNSQVVVMMAVNSANGGTQVSAPAGWTRQFNEFAIPATGRTAGVMGMTFNTNPTSSAVSGGNATSDQNAHSAAWTWALKEASGATDLVVQDLAQSQTFDSPALTQTHSLAVQDIAQGQTLSNVALTQVHNLTVADLSQTQTFDNVVLATTTVTNLVVQSLAQVQTFDNVTLNVIGTYVPAPPERTSSADAEPRLGVVTAASRKSAADADSRISSAAAEVRSS